MNELPPEQKHILETFTPKGTWALLLVMAAAMAVGWAALFVLFLSHGPVN